MNKTINVSNVEETIELGKKIGQLLQPGMMITLNGDLGAGKTTFTKGIGQALEINRIINFTNCRNSHFCCPCWSWSS